jgi:magnesium chelatase family protein
VPCTAATFILDGLSARPLQVEVDVHRGLPDFSILGFSHAAAQESRERVRAALVNCGFEFPMRRVVVKVAPPKQPKAGVGVNLAIAAALLAASGQIDGRALQGLALVGELALDGLTRSICGVIPIAEAAQAAGLEAIVVPSANAEAASLVQGIEVIGIEALGQIRALLDGSWRPPRPQPLGLRREPAPGAPDMADLRGQPHLRHALEVSAAGGHSLLMIGPPGAGKSLAATRLPSILPPLAQGEALEVARIASVCGRLGAELPGPRPFRAPHHTISSLGLIGGGTPTRPGEVTLAHRGILFLDDLCEFRRESLEALRAPLEAGEVSIGPADAQGGMPCRFMLIAATNPCPCGRGEADPSCSCSPWDLQRYAGVLSGARADRIDIYAAAPRPTAAEIAGPPGETSAMVRERVCAARERQQRRLGSGRCNAEMSPAEARACPISDGAALILGQQYERQRLSGRAHDRALRLAQTLVDLAGLEEIGEEQMAQALQLRRRQRG